MVDATEQGIVHYIANGEGRSTASIAKHVGLSTRTTQHRLAALEQRGLIAVVGSGPRDPRRRWYVVRNGRSARRSRAAICGRPSATRTAIEIPSTNFMREVDGLQSVYLTQIGTVLASTLFALIGKEATSVADFGHEIGKIERDSPAPERDMEEWERRVEAAIVTDSSIRETERTSLVQARRGQGLFRDNVSSIERACRITKVR